MIIISLTKNLITGVDNEDADLAQFNWHAQTDRHGGAYAARTVYPPKKGKEILLHRLILERVLGRELVKGEFVDHKDGDSLNNSRDNLRVATHKQNAQNRKKHSNGQPKYKGISWHKRVGKYAARIWVDGKLKHLGYFTDPAEAHEAYKRAAREHFGEFARFD